MFLRSDGRGEVLFCRLVTSVLHGRRIVMQPAAASIVCSALRRWADDGGGSGGGLEAGEGTQDETDESGDRQLQVEALTALAALVGDNMGQVFVYSSTYMGEVCDGERLFPHSFPLERFSYNVLSFPCGPGG